MGMPYTIPRATYRLQLGRHLTFAGVAELGGYLARLGVSHAYLSPILKVRRGSTHGYDVIEHGELNPELGSIDDFRAMARSLRVHGIGLLLDIVPNHMAVGGDDNRYWLDVLARGRESRYAEWFDINWTPDDPELTGRVLLPLLGEPYPQALRSGALRLVFDHDTDTFAVWAHDTHKLPLDPQSYEAVVGDLAQRHRVDAAVSAINADPAALDAIIKRQHWRIVHHTEARRINYRRFFTVNDLAGIRVEREDVFDHVHRLVFRLVEEGLVDGLRIDHVDGLYDPKGYCLMLRRKCPRPIYIVVEKILAPHEWLPEDWGIDGTTGYEFGARVVSLLADPAGKDNLTSAYRAFTEHRASVPENVRTAKLEVLDNDLVAELDSLAGCLARLLPSVPRAALRGAVRAIIAELAVYRTYVDEGGASVADARSLAVAIAAARRRAGDVGPAVFDSLEALLCRPRPGEPLQVVRRLQQLTGPVMAKGLEDRALFRTNRLIALNDVGARPDRFGASVGSFHDFNRRRLQRMPNGLLAGSTHDSKRGEDARARIVAIAGDASEWAEQVVRWRAMLSGAGASQIDPNDLWYFFQQLLGAWPAEFGLQEVAAFRQRLEAAMIKAVREAARHSSWTSPNPEYERAVAGVVRAALSTNERNAFLASFRAYDDRIGWIGAQNALIATLLKVMSPGVPDIYQGAELWETSMVDPDNRRPVDFAARRRALEGITGRTAADLAPTWRDGRIKLALTAALLRFRAEHPALLAEGSYEPIRADGSEGEQVCAFARRLEGQAIVAAARLWPDRPVPADCHLYLPDGTWRDLLTHTCFAGSRVLSAAELFRRLPVAALVPES